MLTNLGGLRVLYYPIHRVNKTTELVPLVGWLLEDGFITIDARRIKFDGGTSYASKQLSHSSGTRNDQMGDIL